MKRKHSNRPSVATTHSRRRFLKGALGTAALLQAPAFIRNSGASKLRKVKFQLAWIPSGEYTPWFAAKEMGVWSDLGLDVEISRGFGSGKTAKNVSLGQFDVGEASFGLVANTASKGGPLVALAARYQKSPVGIMALTKKGLKKPKDLEGMTVGSAAFSGAYRLFPAFAKATKLDASKVKFQMISPAAYFSSLLAGKVDALATYYVSQAPPLLAKDIPFDFLFFADYQLDMLDQTLITRPDSLKKDRELYRNFVRGALKGVAFSYLNPQKTVDIAMKQLAALGFGKGSRRNVELAKGVATALGISDAVEKRGIGWMEPALVKATVDKVVTYLGANKIDDLDALYTNEFVGGVNLKPEQWAKLRAESKKYLPS